MIYHVYILTNKNRTVLYTGFTGNIEQRIFLHKVKYNPKSFSAKYNCNELVYYEEFGSPTEAIHREKQLKKYHRVWKMDLINKMNREWKDLSDGWYDQREFESFKNSMREKS